MNCEIIISEHYKSVRAEEMDRIKQRDRYFSTYILAVAGIGGLYLKDENLYWILNGVSILSCYAGLMYSNSDISLGALSSWLWKENTKVLCEYKDRYGVGFYIAHWDGSSDQQKFCRSAAFGSRYYARAFLLLTTGALCPILSIYLMPKTVAPQWPYYEVVSYLLVLPPIVGALSIIRARRIRIHQMTTN